MMMEEKAPSVETPKQPQLGEDSPLINIKFKRKTSATNLNSSSPSKERRQRRSSSGPLTTIEAKQKEPIERAKQPIVVTETVAREEEGKRVLARTAPLAQPTNSNNDSLSGRRSQSMGELVYRDKPTEQKVGVLPPQAILNQESHHVRTALERQQKEATKNKQPHIIDVYKEMERRLVRSIQIETRLERIIKDRIMMAILENRLRVPLISFMNSRHGVEFVSDYRKLEAKYDIIKLTNQKDISDSQFSLDLLHNEVEYSNIVSILIYLSNHSPRLVYIISRHEIAFSLKPPEVFVSSPSASENNNNTVVVDRDNMVLFQKEKQQEEEEASGASYASISNHHLLSMTPKSGELTLLDRAFMNIFKEAPETAFYYMIIVDLAQSHRTTTLAAASSKSSSSMPSSKTNFQQPNQNNRHVVY